MTFNSNVRPHYLYNNYRNSLYKSNSKIEANRFSQSLYLLTFSNSLPLSNPTFKVPVAPKYYHFSKEMFIIKKYSLLKLSVKKCKEKFILFTVIEPLPKKNTNNFKKMQFLIKLDILPLLLMSINDILMQFLQFKTKALYSLHISTSSHCNSVDCRRGDHERFSFWLANPTAHILDLSSAFWLDNYLVLTVS